MSDSAFMAMRSVHDNKLLFVKRADGQWWLPGGSTETAGEETHVDFFSSKAREWCQKLFGDYKIDATYFGGIGIWTLSPEAGGHIVCLQMEDVKPNKVQLRNNVSHLATELAFFNLHEIYHHLYNECDMPWGQAKLAVYVLCAIYKDDKRRAAATGLLKSDLGVINGINWRRP